MRVHKNPFSMSSLLASSSSSSPTSSLPISLINGSNDVISRNDTTTKTKSTPVACTKCHGLEIGQQSVSSDDNKKSQILIKRTREKMRKHFKKITIKEMKLKISRLVFISCFIFISFLLHSTHSFNVDDSIAVGRSAHEPKFGERLLPLSRKKSNVIMPSTSSSSKNLNKNNYFVAVTASEASFYEKFIHNNVTATDNTTAELYTLVDDDDSGEHFAAMRPRQAKQLNRREDTNVEDQAAFVAPLISTNFSKADRLIEMSTEFFVVPTTSAKPPNSKTSSSSSIVGVKTRVNGANDGVAPRSVLIVAPSSKTSSNNNSNHATPPTIVSTYPTTSGFTGLRKEPWVVPVLVLAALTMLMMGAFEIFVLFKAWRTSPSRRHLFLGQMLLLGLFGCAGLGAIITAQPSLLSCGTIRFGVGVSYALVFAALLVKCVFLISLNGGVYLPAPYQGLLLLFAVLIQVAIGAQWLLTQPPEIYTLSVPIVGNGLLASTVASSTLLTTSTTMAAASTVSSSSAYSTLFHPSNAELYTRITATGTVLIPLCKTQFSELLFSLIYIIFLIVFVAVLAIKSRGIRDNYREATYIGLAIGGAIPIWLGWTLCGLAVAERHKDACIAFGLVATSATVFLVMFMPKGRQLAAMGKEGLYVEDREEQFSSLSRAGSGYSPSFFHFKPIKYGVMSGGGGGLQHSNLNIANGTSGGKHCSNGGDRVALVSAAPPSYTRMYHYFPAPPFTPTHHHHHHHPFCFYPQPPPPMPAPPPPPIPPPPALSPTTIAHLAQQHQQQQQVTPLPLPPPPKAQSKNKIKNAQLTQLVTPPTLKQLGNSLATMTQAHLAQTLRYPGLFIRPDESNLYTTLEPTLSSNPNVYFQRGGAVHPGMMY